MAGDWIKMRKNLLGDPRVVRIMSALRADRFRTVGGLFAAWCLLDEQTTDGRLEGYTAEIFDELVGIPGIATAMQSVGWLEIGANFVAAPRFSEHNGQTAKRRAQDLVRKMSAREADKCLAIKRTKSGLENREEKTNGTTNVVLVDNELPTGIAIDKSKESESSGIVFAMSSGTYDLSEQKLAGYVAAYRFDVRRELMKAAIWLRDKPHRRPRTKSTMQAFLTRWLNRHDDRGKPSEQLSGRIGNDPKLEAEMERVARIKRKQAEDLRNGKVPSIPTE